MTSKQLTGLRWIRQAKSRLGANWRTLTSDFDYSKDYFFSWDYLLAAAGVRLKTDNPKIRRWWNLYRVLSSAPFLVVGWNAVLNIVLHTNLAMMTICVQVVITMVITLIRMVIIARCQQSIQTVRRYVNERQFGRDLDPSLHIRGSAFYRIRRFIATSWILQYGVPISCVVINISNHLLAWPIIDRTQGVLILEKLVALFTITGISMVTVATMTVYLILVGLRTELQVIAECFGTVLNRANNRAQLELESTPGNSEQLQKETKRYFWKFVQEELGDCIKLHQKLLSTLATIRPFLNATFLAVYYSTASSIACGAFYVVYSRTVSLMVVHSGYLVGQMLLECAIFTRVVTLLTEMNKSIGEQLYNMDWPTQFEFDTEFIGEYRSVRQTMLTVMAMTQQPLRINCFGFFEFTQDKFTKLVMMSYDLVSFFRSFV